MPADLAARIRERLDATTERDYPEMQAMRDAILSVLAKHPHIRATDESSRHVDTLGHPHDFGCGNCHTWRRGSSSLDGRGWCETVTDIARALGIEADGG